MKKENSIKAVWVKIMGRVVLRYAVVINGQIRLYASSTCAEVAK